MEVLSGRLLLPLLVVLMITDWALGWQQQQHERILLRDVQVLTLHQGRYTTSRRTSPVPHLQCIGGSAGCKAYTPEVVQCYNKGWDGYDVQWECKAHMDISYRFGKIEVSCEGYDYPDDSYILKGSCGLEYTLELTKEGQQKSNTFAGSYYSATSHDSLGTGVGVILVILFVVFIFGIYKLFLCNNQQQHGASYDGLHSETYRQGYQSPPQPGFKTNSQDYQVPPQPGFKSNFTGSGSGSMYDSNSGPGFWTGLGAGGLLGYLVGNRRSPSQYTHSPYYSTWAGPTSPPSFTSSFGTSNSCTSSQNSGTRSTSGFGGTKRR